MLCPAWLANPAFWWASYYFWKGSVEKARKAAVISVYLSLSFWAWLLLGDKFRLFGVGQFGPVDYRATAMLLPYWVWLSSFLFFATVTKLAASRQRPNS
jgi:hypothetical protein